MRSTYAKIWAIAVSRRKRDKTRSFFEAQLIALKLNGPKSERQFTPDDILAQRYPRDRALEDEIKHDPDHGALGDWRGMKQGLKDLTKAGAQRRRRR